MAMTSTLPQQAARRGAAQSSLAMPVALALFVLSLTQPYLFQFGPVTMAPYRLLLLVLIIPLLFNWAVGKYGAFIVTDFLVLGHLLWILTSLIANGQFNNIAQFWSSQVIDIAGAYFLGRAALRSRQDLIYFTRLFLISLLILLPFAIIESVGRVMVLNDIAQQIPLAEAHKRSTLEYPPRFGLQRAQTATPHPILYGITSAMAFSLAWLVLRHSTKPPVGLKRWFWLSGSIGGTFLALSSGGWLNLLLQICLISYNRIFRPIAARWKILLCTGAAFYVFVIFYSERPPPLVFAKMIALDAQTAFFRYLIYEYGSAEVMRNPVFGLGLFTDYIRPAWMVPSVDNHWLLQAMRWGLPGAAMLVIAAFYPVYRMARRDFSKNPVLSDMRYAMVFTMITYYISMATVAVWNIQYPLIMLLIGGSAWLISVAPETEQTGTGDADTRPSASKRRLAYTRFPQTQKDAPEGRLRRSRSRG